MENGKLKNKLAVFDFDSTLMDGETLEILARELGLDKEVKEVTDKAMRGELDFFESLQYRVSLLKGLSEAKVNEICKMLPPMPGAREVIKGLKERGYKVVCFSGGFRNGTTPFAEKFGLDADFSNLLHAKDGVLTGKVGGEMMFGTSKGEMLVRLQSLMGITPADTLVVGDGANDLSMFKYADTRVAFCAKPVLKEEATIIIDIKDLTELLKFI